jgi:hypothetical protein
MCGIHVEEAMVALRRAKIAKMTKMAKMEKGLRPAFSPQQVIELDADGNGEGEGNARSKDEEGADDLDLDPEMDLEDHDGDEDRGRTSEDSVPTERSKVRNLDSSQEEEKELPVGETQPGIKSQRLMYFGANTILHEQSPGITRIYEYNHLKRKTQSNLKRQRQLLINDRPFSAIKDTLSNRY